MSINTVYTATVVFHKNKRIYQEIGISRALSHEEITTPRDRCIEKPLFAGQYRGNVTEPEWLNCMTKLL